MLQKLFAIIASNGRYFSEYMIYQHPETGEWLYYFTDKPNNLYYDYQIEDAIVRLQEKQKKVGLNLKFHKVEIVF